MFSTFTGSSRRPRNVNLSGQAGNPFANTAWSPSVVSNATKTVSNAQAEREKRQAERHRLKAAGRIQRTWRGHRVRRTLRESRRAEFDQLYKSAPSSSPLQRLSLGFPLLLAFFSRQRNDDLRRLLLFVRDSETIDLQDISSPNLHASRVRRLARILVDAIHRAAQEEDERESSQELQLLVKFTTRISSTSPQAFLGCADKYYSVLGKLCQRQGLDRSYNDVLLQAILAPLVADAKDGHLFSNAFAFSFLTTNNLSLWESSIREFSKAVSLETLAQTILEGFTSASAPKATKDGLLWLLAHFIDLNGATPHASHDDTYLEALYTQLATLATEISVRLGAKSLSDPSVSDDDVVHEEPLLQALDPYINHHLMSLIENDGINKVLRDFSHNELIVQSQRFRRTNLLAGYILTLLRCYPGYGDDIRMRLFLEQIRTTSGELPTVKYLWNMMRETAIFHKLVTESESPIRVLRRYLRPAADGADAMGEENDWRVILLFLELYIFILRLSDDEDFFSGIYPRVLQSQASTSRMQACSLSRDDVKALTSFLKNTAFCLHYKAQELSQSREALDAATRSRMETYLSGRPLEGQVRVQPMTSPASTTRLDLDSLRTIITMAMKMLYERDSRKQFLPANHWLMTDKLDQEGFVAAVIAEEERQVKEDSDASDDEGPSDIDTPFGASGFHSTFAGQRLSRHARMEQLRTQQMRAIRERRLAEMGPKLEILKHMPFVVPFETRVLIFRKFIQLDKIRRDYGNPFPFNSARHHAQIRRDQLFEDAYKHYYPIGDGFKDAIQISFVDKFGTAEAGIDGGGVTKEFLISVTNEAFGDGGKGPTMFASSEKGLLYPNPTTVDVLRESLRAQGVSNTDPEWNTFMSHLINRYEFLGRIVGKCLYEGILVDLAFAGFFLLKWTSTGPNDENTYKGSVNDLRDMDEDLYNGMLRLKNYSGDVSELGIDYTIADLVSRKGERVKTITRKLVPNGDQLYVTNDNRLLYISYVARHRLVVQPHLQTAAFLRGLRAIIRPSWLSMFNQSELQRLVGGDSSEIDIQDLRSNTIYSGLYQIGDDGEEHPTIKLFWKVLRGFTDQERRDFLKYVSSTPRAPLLGFSQLQPKFSIRDGGTDEERLPSTSTCVNLLKLPQYTTEAALRRKLLYAISSGAGFDLS